MAFSQQFMDDLGGLGALWAGREQGMQENTTLANQQNTLEQIATSQQNRDIAAQKLPYELADLQAKNALAPELLKEKQLGNQKAQQALDKEKFNTFFEQFKDTIPTLQGTPADGAILSEVAKKHGMDPADPRIRSMIDTASSGNRQAIDAMLKRIALMSEKSIAEREKQAEADKAHMERTRAEITGRENVALINERAGNSRAQITAAARANAQAKKESLLAITKGDPVKTKAALIQLGNEARAKGDMDQANAFYDQANDPSLSALAANQQAQRPTTTIDQQGNIGQAGGVKEVPPAGGQPVTKAPPVVGEVRGGYKFKGGNPADKNNWEKQ